jgi:putative iron-dependent peroxidase
MEEMLTGMFIGKPPGDHDRSVDSSTSVSCQLFSVPTRDVLDDRPAARLSARPDGIASLGRATTP